jgi:hypothetical protein
LIDGETTPRIGTGLRAANGPTDGLDGLDKGSTGTVAREIQPPRNKDH